MEIRHCPTFAVRVAGDVQMCLLYRRHQLAFVKIYLTLSSPDSSRVKEMSMTSTFSELRVKHFLSLLRVGRSGCTTLHKRTFQRRLGHRLIGNSVNSVLSCNLSSTAHICFLRKYFSFAYAKIQNMRSCDVISVGKINSEFPILEAACFDHSF